MQGGIQKETLIYEDFLVPRNDYSECELHTYDVTETEVSLGKFANILHFWSIAWGCESSRTVQIQRWV